MQGKKGTKGSMAAGSSEPTVLQTTYPSSDESDQEEGEVHVANYARAAVQFPTFTRAEDIMGPFHCIVVQTAMPVQSKPSKSDYYGLSSSRFSFKKRDEQAGPVVSRMHEV
jgi:hypothetical protein